MNKLKNSTGKIGKYLREISVVVIGVAITLSASNWITNRNEKRDMSLYLNAIKLELEENKKELDEVEKNMQGSVRYADYLNSHDKKLLNADTIRTYVNDYYGIYSITVKTNAFDMFKISGNMRFVDDKELLITIWDAYATLNKIEKLFDLYSQMKLEEIKKAILPPKSLLLFSDEEILKNIPMYNFYTQTRAPYMQPEECNIALIIVNETISKLEEAKEIKQ